MNARILAFDTSGPYCAAAILQGNTVTARHEEMARGQAERLMGFLEELLTDAQLRWADLDAIGVGTGPGNFTGIRISVAAARGLSLGLGIPAYGVTGFEQRAGLDGLIWVPAGRDQIYVQLPDGIQLRARADTEHLDRSLCPSMPPEACATAIAQHAGSLWPSASPPPAPFYVRAADAAPPREAPPVILDA